ncbi:WXG100 family type VII secretion target [Streptomyces lydicus]|nr:WXG100 family type VII secretion target [Streptomyces lydicus]
MSERGNPEALREAAAGWREMGKHLDGLVHDLDRHVGTAAAANWHGPAGEAFAGEWHRLKRSVDDALPVFELAAADLETAAAQPADDQSGKDHGAPPVHHAADDAQSSSGPGSPTASWHSASSRTASAARSAGAVGAAARAGGRPYGTHGRAPRRRRGPTRSARGKTARPRGGAARASPRASGAGRLGRSRTRLLRRRLRPRPRSQAMNGT